MRNGRGNSRKKIPHGSVAVPHAADIKKTVRIRVPTLPFEKMTRVVLGPRYELSLVVCGDKLARAINTKYRHKTYAANVLSFPLGRDEGEIFLNARAAEREARKYGISVSARLALLFVHGLFHLKGLIHGDKMEAEERKILKRFGF
ncbi:MAG TPA: rRNA maturation RNase YbeY [Candidatus Paceibacterota bacterium]